MDDEEGPRIGRQPAVLRAAESAPLCPQRHYCRSDAHERMSHVAAEEDGVADPSVPQRDVNDEAVLLGG